MDNLLQTILFRKTLILWIKLKIAVCSIFNIIQFNINLVQFNFF